MQTAVQADHVLLSDSLCRRLLDPPLLPAWHSSNHAGPHHDETFDELSAEAKTNVLRF